MRLETEYSLMIRKFVKTDTMSFYMHLKTFERKNPSYRKLTTFSGHLLNSQAKGLYIYYMQSELNDRAKYDPLELKVDDKVNEKIRILWALFKRAGSI